MQHYDESQIYYPRPHVQEYHPNGVTGISSTFLRNS